jgi:hypothetical protein
VTCKEQETTGSCTACNRQPTARSLQQTTLQRTTCNTQRTPGRHRSRQQTTRTRKRCNGQRTTCNNATATGGLLAAHAAWRLLHRASSAYCAALNSAFKS